MLESDGAFASTITDIYESIFYHYISKNASHEDEIFFFPPQGMTSSASRPEIPRKYVFHYFTGKGG